MMETYEKRQNNKKSVERRVLLDRRLADDDIMVGYERRGFRDRRKTSNGIKHTENGK